MKKMVLFFVMCLFFFGCEDKKVQNFGQNPVFTEHCDTSAVWRVKTHSFDNLEIGYIAIALDNGKRFSVKFHNTDVTKDWMLLDEGDTVVYQGDQILSVIWKKH